MSSNGSVDIAPGHLGNLTTEQEALLRKLWQTVFMLYNMFEHAGQIVPDAEPPKRAGLLGRKSQEAAPAAKPSADVIEALQVITTDPQEQQRLSKQFTQLMAMKTPESIKLFRQGLEAAPRETIAQWRDLLADQSAESIREFQKILQGQSAQEIRAMVTGAVKHEHPDMVMLRFLRARKWDVNKALAMMLKAMNWRFKDFKVDEDIMTRGEAGAVADAESADKATKTLGHDFMKQIRMGKSFLHGTDRQGRILCVVRARLHKASDQCAESVEKYTTYLIETSRLMLNPPVETACLVFDMTNFTLANMDYVPVKFIIMCFEANYPESLGAVLIHNAPWIFKGNHEPCLGIWKVIHGWLDPVIAAKVHFTYTRKDLEEFIAPEHIIKELGGDEDWEYKYEEPVEGENEPMKDTATRDKLQLQRDDIAKRFEDATKEWIRGADGPQAKELKAKRDLLAREIGENYWKLDKYVRARSLYDRQGYIRAAQQSSGMPRTVPTRRTSSSAQSTP
ncbi:CRAL/TRIO domain protein [Metarhizium album ARSEF 1941]|uniref:CRAL/TRIO domain protein n=1 Tax=Metarhizium album (strain ARSEF 1941) TaxID=1081103 RepID=A0A0B2X4U8_METAS|nr:CRAL/TRIO domain protein [Metarhizium album ARSEF 1941]KHO01394.1 CRAL/TRIO domain protein [Metarhizium album ARSEF 1941]